MFYLRMNAIHLMHFCTHLSHEKHHILTRGQINKNPYIIDGSCWPRMHFLSNPSQLRQSFPLRLVSRVASVMEDGLAVTLQGNAKSFGSGYKDKAPISKRIADLWYLLGYLERQIPDLPHDRCRRVSPRPERAQSV